MNYENNYEFKNLLNTLSMLISCNQIKKAKEIISDLIKKHPKWPEGYYHLSICEFYSNNIDKAIELCEKSLDLGMNQLSVRTSLMYYYNEKNHFEKVDKQFELLRTTASDNNDVLAIYGYSLCKRGQVFEGERILQDAISWSDNKSLILNYLYCSTKQHRKRKKENTTLLKIYMNSSIPEVNKLIFVGKYEINLRNWRAANNYFKKAIGVDPLNKEVLEYLKIIEIRRKAMPLLLIIFIVITFLIYEIKFNPSQIITYLYFFPSLIVIMLFLICMYGVNKISNLKY
ncbi:MAG: tetratricopeptide repeat protein [Clostridiaceae bacterium]